MAAAAESPALKIGAPILTPPAPVAKIAAINAARNEERTRPHGGPPGTPWAPAANQATAEIRGVITAAYKRLELDMAAANAMIDNAYSAADQVSAQLEAAGWAAYNKYMQSAANARSNILTPAVAAYETLVQAAHDEFMAAAGNAEAEFQVIIGAIQRGKTLYTSAGQVP